MYNIHITLYHPTCKHLYLLIYVIFLINSNYKKGRKAINGAVPFYKTLKRTI